MSTTFSNGAAVSDAVSIAGLSTLASGAYSAPSVLIDNTPTGPHGVSYLSGMLRLSFSAALTAGTGAPYITAYLLTAADGANLPNPPGSAASAPMPNARQVIGQLIASAAFSIVDFSAVDLDPFLYGVQLYNASGVAFSGTATLTLYRWTPQGA